MKRLCAVDGCGAPNFCKGLCSKHFQRFKKTGSTALSRRENGSGTVTALGYIVVGGKAKPEHVSVAERAIGKALPIGAEVHHINGVRNDNRPENLVVCPNHAYHSLLHVRANALAACGNASWRSCEICRKYDDPAAMRPHRHQFRHAECIREYNRERRATL